MTSALQVRVPSWNRASNAVREWRPNRHRLPHALLALAFFAAYTTVSTVRYAHYGSPSWDLAIFTEAVKNYAHLHAPIADIKGPGFNVLGDHFSPAIATLAPLWWLWPNAAVLLLAQDALFAISVGIVSNTAHRILGRQWGLLIGVAYGLSFGVQRAVDVEFHEIAFAVPLLAVVGRQLLMRRWARACWWTVPLVLVKEDMGLTVAAVGVLVAMLARDWGRSRRWLTGLAMVTVGVGCVLLTVLWLIPHFNPAHHFDYWAKVPGGAHHTRWWALLAGPFTRWTVWTTVVWTLGVAGFVCVRSPLLILAVPTLAWRFTSDNATFWGTGWHYSAVVMPVAFLALADAVDRCKGSRQPRVRSFAAGIVPAIAGVAVACSLALPTGVGNLALRDTWRSTARDTDLNAAEKAVPADVTVECDTPLLARLAARDTVYWPGGDKRPPQYIVDDGGAAPADMLRWAREGHGGREYRVVFHRGQVTVIAAA